MHELTISRRRFLRFSAGAVMAGATTFGYARSVEPGWLDVQVVDLPIRGLSPRLAGRTLAQMSDIHLGKYTSADKLLSAITAVNALAPDWVMLTGDFICSDVSEATALVEPLRALQSPAFAALGNHDLRSGGEAVIRSLAETPVTLLRNDGVSLEDGLWLAGLDDAWHGAPDIRTALEDLPAGATALLMVHEPDYFNTLLGTGAPFAAQFSGHTHGGQVRLPRVTADRQPRSTWAPVLPHMGEQYSMGLYAVEDRFVYTNRGIGVWPLPYRINCRPEVTLFTLHEA